jgi:AcrR family transcriptional regulator
MGADQASGPEPSTDADMDMAEFETDELDTRTKLILAAERLFGERGIDAVPLREVVAAAGQRNASALLYHIGGREELVLAILEFRRTAVDARRVELLDEYESAGVTMDETAIAAGAVIPLVELMLGDPRGGDYLRFLSQAYVTERPESAYRSTGETDKGMRRCYRLYRARHPNIAPRRLRERFSICCRGAIYALADWQRDAAVPRSSIPRTGLAGFSGDLIAITARGLAAISEREHRLVPFAVLHGDRRGVEEQAAE